MKEEIDKEEESQRQLTCKSRRPCELPGRHIHSLSAVAATSSHPLVNIGLVREEYREMEDVGGAWLRAATPMEMMFETAHQKGTLLICYHVILNSSVRLQEEHVVSTGDVQSTMEHLRTYKYNSTAGPLWCARLLRGVEHPDGGLDSSSSPPFVSHLFLGYHHGIVDGVTTMKVCGCLVKLLGDVISGQPISDEEQIGELVSAEETEKLVQAKKLRIETDHEYRETLIREAKSKCSHPRLLRRLYQAPEGTEDRSAQVVRHLDVATTEKFVNKCRAEGLTVHSAFTALANVALVDLLTRKGVIQDSYTICSAHTTNLRRYWPGDTTRALGCHIAPTYLHVETPRNALHLNLKSYLEAGKALEDVALRQLTPRAKAEEREDREDKEENIDAQADYFTSNMGDVTPFLSQGSGTSRRHASRGRCRARGRPLLLPRLPHTFKVVSRTASTSPRGS
ncbi:Malonyl CoA-acyl carrier protein transacylase [Penaeus vannamei]|uniref:Malonyl CoA-acyl carrier protein transacylase n=1 Tax=Penaeus vannamei TaxID=6689 RepID=A0A423TCY1_PENVA|nr:Malonyl CoA-acyl carrier protein transacylase [Penaeus vannamei]